MAARATSPADLAPDHADDLWHALVAAAAEVFAEKGYDGARVQDVARRAGVTVGAIYNRFSGKAELLAEAIRLHSPSELDALLGQAAGGRLDEALVDAGTRLPQRQRSDRALLLEAFVAARRNDDVRASVGSLVAERTQQLAGLVRDAQADGVLDPGLDTDALARFCQALSFGFLLLGAVDGQEVPADGWEQLIRRVVASFEHEPQ